MDKSLSFDDVKKIIGNKNHTYLVTAQDKDKMYLLSEGNRSDYINFIIHYQTEHNNNTINGHWVCIVVDKIRKNVYFFDSYGRFPDDSLLDINVSYRSMTNQNQKDVCLFMDFMDEMGYTIHYNDHKYQNLKPGVNTCGRWVSLFCKYVNMGNTDEDFYKYIQSVKKQLYFKNLDNISIYLTEKFLK